MTLYKTTERGSLDMSEVLEIAACEELFLISAEKLISVTCKFDFGLVALLFLLSLLGIKFITFA